MSGPVLGQETPGTTASDYNMLAFVFDMLISQINTLKLVKVVSCTNAGGVAPVGTLVVQPLVNQMTPGGTPVPHDKLYAVPYFRLQGGTSAVILDPNPGDIGLCGFCDRDISNVKATKGQANPGSSSMFDWADGLYLGGFLNGTPEQYIAFSSAGIFIYSPTQITIQAPTINLTGTVDANGATISEAGEVTDAAGVVLGTHPHSLVQPGSGNSGPPVAG